MARRSVKALLVTLCIGLLLAPVQARKPDTVEQQFRTLLRQCERDPANRVGGAAIGECLLDHAAQRDADIARTLESLLRDKPDVVQASLRDAQAHWAEYRTRQCGMFQALFDNTPMYVNGGVCTLRLTLARQADLEFAARYQPGVPQVLRDGKSAL